MNLVIVESPAKAKTINKYLGKDYEVMASYGHVRDLPSKNGSVLPDDDFEMTWDVDSQSSKTLKAISEAVKRSDKLILATDPDREGEAISWHILEVLNNKGLLKDKDIERVAFNAVTKSAILDAISHPRQIDEQLVEAYLARRALDYLVGFTLSPVLWRKLPGSRSAGRVQSVALRIVCEREKEIEAFVAREYWTIDALAKSAKDEPIESRLVKYEGEKLDKFDLPNEEVAHAAVAAVKAETFTVAAVEKKPARRNPSAPFTTSTLQQEASRKLGFSARQTMMLAQRLYEGIDIGGETTGLITYMRTDGIEIAPEAMQTVRETIGSKFGDTYLPDAPRVYKSKAKNAQEAHEAIRPTDVARAPEDLKSHLEADQHRLYELIWKRTIASQMESARLERTTIELASSDDQIGLRATGSVLVFDGFLKVYEESRDESKTDDDDKRLPAVQQGEAITLADVNADQHFTEPPPRYSEASLVKKLEELGIGRPSTYASILSVLQDRKYVRLEQKRFFPEDKGRLVTAFLENFFQKYVEYDFTAGLEEKLDLVSAGDLNWKEFLRNFWTEFHAAVDSISDLRITNVLDALNVALAPHVFPEIEAGKDPRACPSCEDGRLSLKVGRFGAFVGCSNYPECKYTRQFSVANENDILPDGEPKVLGQDPETGLELSLRSGRFGPYIQLGDGEDGEKPKRGSIPRGVDASEIDFEKALFLVSLPREIGAHPETQNPISVGIGRYGPYVLHDGTYASISDPEEVFSIGLNRAVTLLAEKATKGGGRRGSTAKPLKELGEHPELGGPVNVLDGRYGPYVKHGRVNASLPKEIEPDQMTLEMAVDLLNKKSSKGAAKKAAKKKTAKKKAAKKTTKKATKKSTTKKKETVVKAAE